jgi:DNA-binding CsgD family transcriptional regulator
MIAPSPGEIAELALACREPRDFREEIARRVCTWIGGDGAWFHTIDPTLPLSRGSWHGLDLAPVERARAGWAAYSVELAPLLQASIAGGVADTLEVFSERERDRGPFFREVGRPLGIERSLWLGLAGGGHLASIGVCRARGDFRRVPRDQLRALLPVLTLADRALVSLARARPSERVLAQVSPRQRQVIELVVLGYTNGEIARALGVSINTVRNQLAATFHKVGVSTRAELVALVLGALPC